MNILKGAIKPATVVFALLCVSGHAQLGRNRRTQNLPDPTRHTRAGGLCHLLYRGGKGA